MKTIFRDYEIGLLSSLQEPQYLEERVAFFRRKLSEPRDEMYLSLGSGVKQIEDDMVAGR